MELVKPEIAKSEGRIPHRSSPRGRCGTTNAQASLQWVTARVPANVVREIEAHAKRNGTTRSEAIRECVAVGLETIQHREGVPSGRVEELLGGIESVPVLLELIGPPTFGIHRLLA